MSTSPSTAKRAAAGVLLALLAGCRALGGALDGAAEEPAFAREIRALNDDLEEQFRAGNLLGVADVYADDAVLVDARGARTSGREEIDAYWSAIESPVDWELEVETIRGSDVVAYETGVSRLATRRDGVERLSVSHFVLLWRRGPDREWRIELDAYWPVQSE